MIPLVSDTGERLQWNLTLVKSLFILRGVHMNTHPHTYKHIHILAIPLTLLPPYSSSTDGHSHCFFVFHDHYPLLGRQNQGSGQCCIGFVAENTPT